MITVRRTRFEVMSKCGFEWVLSDSTEERIVAYFSNEEEAHIAAMAIAKAHSICPRSSGAPVAMLLSDVNL